MAFDANPASTHNPSTSSAPPAAWGDILNANAAALGGATSFTPTWGSLGTAPAYGSATVNGYWQEIGDWMYVNVAITFASTTFGSGGYVWTLPNSRSAAFTQVCGTARMVDSGTAANTTHGILQCNGTSLSIAYAGAASAVSATAPFTFANGDSIRFEGRIYCA